MDILLPLNGAVRTDYSINDASYRGDGGIDGTVDSRALRDPLGFISPCSVFQFKSGLTSASKAREELEKEPPPGEKRIIDRIREGYKLVWFVGKALTDELPRFEDDLARIVHDIDRDAPRPSVIDANRLADYLIRAPSLASELMGSNAAFMTVRAALSLTAHRRLEFVPSADFPQMVEDFRRLLGSGSDGIRYLSGEPGIGKTRSVLQAIRDTGFEDAVCYFPTQQGIRDFLTDATQNALSLVAIVDEYVPDADTDRIDPRDIPDGVRVIAIGHGYRTNRRANRHMLPVPPLTDQEISQVLALSFPGVPEVIRDQSVSLAKRNVRLASFLCERINPTSSTIGPEVLDEVIAHELNRVPESVETIGLLSLVTLLSRSSEAEFSELVGVPLQTFRDVCRDIAQTSGFVQQNATVVYVAAPAIAHSALLRLWNTGEERVRRILDAPGTFGEAILQRLDRLPDSAAKEEMLAYFRPAGFPRSLSELQSSSDGRNLLTLLTADPDRYLPKFHALFQMERRKIATFPYEGSGIGRRDIIWKLRELAQFPEYFSQCEEIVYWMARDEVPSAYSNKASSYWVGWFRPYFDHTAYPLQERYDLLQARIKEGDHRDRELIAAAVANSFPEVGTDIPREVVGGRIAPPETRLILHRNVAISYERLPELVATLLRSAQSQDERIQIAKATTANYFEWLRNLGDSTTVAEVVTGSDFPKETRRNLAASVRSYLALPETGASDEFLRHMKALHRDLYEKIQVGDFLEDLRFLVRAGPYEIDHSPDLQQLEEATLERLGGDPSLIQSMLGELTDNKNYGAGRLAAKLSQRLDVDQLRGLLEQRLNTLSDTSPFTLSLLRSAVGRFPEWSGWIRARATEGERSHALWSLTIVSNLDYDAYFQMAARLLDEGIIDARVLSNRWFFQSEEQVKPLLPLIGALGRRVDQGDAEAAKLALTLLHDLSLSKVEFPGVEELGIKALKTGLDSGGWSQSHEWIEVALWLLPHRPAEVIRLVASLKLSDHSEALRVLTKAAKAFPHQVIEALGPRLERTYEPPYLFAHSINSVIAELPLSEYQDWIAKIDTQVAIGLAGQLPRPSLLDDETAVVPEHTRIFFERFGPWSEGFDKMLSQFHANTFSTGVYSGYGEKLFTDREKMAERLIDDVNPSIRLWAEQFAKSSHESLTDARHRKEMHEAIMDTSDR